MDTVIVLNKYEEYWTEIGLRKALRKLLNDRAVPFKEDTSNLLGVLKLGWGPDAKYKPVYKPLIIKLLYFDYYKYKSDKVPYSDNAVFIRDKSICQYWHYYNLLDGKVVSAEKHQHVCKPSELTIDHVLPISRGGHNNSFTNTVTSCMHCNLILKKDKTPEEAGLELIRQPKVPSRVKGDIARSYFAFNPENKAHVEYNNFLKERNYG
jgi:hypothetical protein